MTKILENFQVTLFKTYLFYFILFYFLKLFFLMYSSPAGGVKRIE